MKVAKLAIARLELHPSESEVNTLSKCIWLSYLHGDSFSTRKPLREALGRILKSRGEASSDFYVTSSILCIIKDIMRGFQSPIISSQNKYLVMKLILPLHEQQGKSHDNLVASLGIFHKELMRCIDVILDLDFGLFHGMFTHFLAHWPDPREGNSPKQVLYFHGLESFLDIAVKHDYSKFESSAREIALQRIAQGITSDNSSICERALLLWKTESIAGLLDDWLLNSQRSFQAVVEPLLTHSLNHWNLTVCRMSGTIVNRYFTKKHEWLLNIAQELWKGVSVDVEGDLKRILLKLQAESTAKTDTPVKVATVIPEKDHAIDFMNMVLAEELGAGTFGTVYRALRVVRGKPRSEWNVYALKRIDASKFRDVAVREVDMMEKVCHPNCTRIISVYESCSFINIVMEYAANGDLHTAIQDRGTIDVASTQFITCEIASALDAFHQQKLLFGDLKPENILIHSNGHVKLSDFGAVRDFSVVIEESQPPEGTLCYLAPELFKRRQALNISDLGSRITVPEAIDWWAFGCVVYQMLTGRPPIWVEHERDMFDRLISFSVDKFPADFPDDAKSLVLSLLEVDPVQRLNNLQDVIAHQFYRDIGIDIKKIHEHKAPHIVSGKVKPQQGPWNQRTFSMLHAPMPQSYFESKEVEPAVSSELIRETDEECEFSWKSSDIVAPFQFDVDAPVVSARITSSPSNRVPMVSSMPQHKPRVFQPMTTMPRSSVPQRKNPFKVGNLDLSAG